MLQLDGGGGEGNKAATPQCLCCFKISGGEGKRKCKRLKVNLPAAYVGFGGPLYTPSCVVETLQTVAETKC